MNASQGAAAPRIMVVDDNPANVELLVRMLGARGYQTQPVLGGVEALQWARHAPPDLVLLDIDMPGMSGFAVCQELKADTQLRDIPVIFISALNEPSDKVRAFQLGGVDYVTKPFALTEVYARVETHLKLRALQRQLVQHNESLADQVAQRTRELTSACQQVRELSRLKGDFLRMISHEMRTPANGVLGLGELLIDLCPESHERTLYARLYAKSSERLNDLLEDASMIAEMDALTSTKRVSVAVQDLLAQMAGAFPGVRISREPSPELAAFFVAGHPPLLLKALKTVLLLALAFSRRKDAAQVTVGADEQRQWLRFAVDELSLSDAQTADFFAVGSISRSHSPAESMGLGPVVAYQIIAGFAGALSLLRGEGSTGFLEVAFARHQPSDPLSGDPS